LLAFSRGFIEILVKVTRSGSARGPSRMTFLGDEAADHGNNARPAPARAPRG
jgi:hypothetical protein